MCRLWKQIVMAMSVVTNTLDPIFDDIRPYRDEEIKPLLEKWAYCESLKTPMVEHLSRHDEDKAQFVQWFDRLKQVDHINAFQRILAELVEWIIETTSEGIEVTGLESLSTGHPHLYLSNHRDIVLDPTLVNYALAINEIETARVAIGDNLVSNPLVGDLMRANKSFLVKRSVEDRRDKLRELTKLSQYIRGSIKEGISVWLAQREGRAKDGLDRTESAVIKMLHLSGRAEKIDMAESLNQLSIVPTTLSYEWNPCDIVLAEQRIHSAEKNDIQDIVQGLVGFKGRIHVHFGEPIEAENVDQVVEQVDQQIDQHHWIFANQLVAYAHIECPHFNRDSRLQSILENANLKKMMEQYRISQADLALAEDSFDERLRDLSSDIQQGVFEYYANPVKQLINRTSV